MVNVGDGVNELDEAVKSVNPVFELVFFVFIDWQVVELSGSPRKSIGTMARTWDMNEGEVEGENRENPVINTSTWLNVWISKHALYVSDIDLDDKVANTK